MTPVQTFEAKPIKIESEAQQSDYPASPNFVLSDTIARFGNV